VKKGREEWESEEEENWERPFPYLLYDITIVKLLSNFLTSVEILYCICIPIFAKYAQSSWSTCSQNFFVQAWRQNLRPWYLDQAFQTLVCTQFDVWPVSGTLIQLSLVLSDKWRDNAPKYVTANFPVPFIYHGLRSFSCSCLTFLVNHEQIL
jgi:hypothetical protein